jgi:DNA-binding beta-propeller fold protein YncE
MVVDSGTDRVFTASPVDGSIINPNFIVDENLSTPIHAIDSGRGTVLISDQILDSVREYDLSGNFIRTVTDNVTSGIDNIRGIAVRGNDLFVTVGGGTFTGTVQRINLTTGARINTFASVGGSPWHILFRANDALISNSADDTIARVDSITGAILGTFHSSDGVNGIDFPQQMFERSNGNILVGGFSLPTGVYEYTSTGTQVAALAPGLGQRGVWELQNGEYLFTAGTRFATVNPGTGTVTDISNVLGNNLRFISLLGGRASAPEPTTIALLLLGGVLGMRVRRR